jgi:hypothetical protein
MHKHDLDLIAALADGSLADETDARALLESCEECRAEHQSQLAIIELLRTTPGAEMSELEKAALHRDLWTQLRNAPSRTRPTRLWYRWSYIAAGLFVTVGLVSVLNGQFQGMDESSDGETRANTDTGSDLGAFSAEDAPETLQDADAASGGSETAAPTTMAAEESLPFPFADLADEARAARESGFRYTQSASPDQVDRCLESAGLVDQVVVEELNLDQLYLVVVTDDDTPEPTVTFVALENCEIVYVDG